MNLTIGQRISTRGEDFIITDSKTNNDGTFLIQAEGMCELVNGKNYSRVNLILANINALYGYTKRHQIIDDMKFMESYQSWSKAHQTCYDDKRLEV